jgi:hypothetical protein
MKSLLHIPFKKYMKDHSFISYYPASKNSNWSIHRLEQAVPNLQIYSEIPSVLKCMESFLSTKTAWKIKILKEKKEMKQSKFKTIP